MVSQISKTAISAPGGTVWVRWTTRKVRKIEHEKNGFFAVLNHVSAQTKRPKLGDPTHLDEGGGRVQKVVVEDGPDDGVEKKRRRRRKRGEEGGEQKMS